MGWVQVWIFYPQVTRDYPYIVVTFVQQKKSSTQFMSILLVADIEINSRFEIGNILHACSRRSVEWLGLDSPSNDRTSSASPNMSLSKSWVWRFRNVKGRVDAVMFNDSVVWHWMVTMRLLNSNGEGLWSWAEMTVSRGPSESLWMEVILGMQSK